MGVSKWAWLALGLRSQGRRKVVSTVVSKQSSPDPDVSFLRAPVTADRIWAALSGEATERVVRRPGTSLISPHVQPSQRGCKRCALFRNKAGAHRLEFQKGQAREEWL